MSSERFELNLGQEGGKKTFETFQQLQEWIGKESQYWQFLLQVNQDSQSDHVARLLNDFFRKASGVLHEIDALKKSSEVYLERAKQAGISAQEAEDFTQRSANTFVPSHQISRLQGLFDEYYVSLKLIPSHTPAANFLRHWQKANLWQQFTLAAI